MDGALELITDCVCFATGSDAPLRAVRLGKQVAGQLPFRPESGRRAMFGR